MVLWLETVEMVPLQYIYSSNEKKLFSKKKEFILLCLVSGVKITTPFLQYYHTGPQKSDQLFSIDFSQAWIV